MVGTRGGASAEPRPAAAAKGNKRGRGRADAPKAALPEDDGWPASDETLDTVVDFLADVDPRSVGRLLCVWCAQGGAKAFLGARTRFWANSARPRAQPPLPAPVRVQRGGVAPPAAGVAVRGAAAAPAG